MRSGTWREEPISECVREGNRGLPIVTLDQAVEAGRHAQGGFSADPDTLYRSIIRSTFCIHRETTGVPKCTSTGPAAW